MNRERAKMIRLTYIRWSDDKIGAMLLNPDSVIAITPSENHGRQCSQVAVQGYTYSVIETVDEIEALIRGRTLPSAMT